ncbi:Glutathione-specific gamma-glutamylcyclotransferase [Grifola frondosa]|uniref:glutathione-specific gamma-glutamylcyclotransferase n=1 Tax=Grifola frondosa TaxID=5627 RepID=A0A1C7M0P0_GRIFR|nr:Glutathione-specific gamma-glutamylcyclotransferase [Grifola frondosa]
MVLVTSERPYVVFGYGSLIFKPPPHVVSETPGFLKGYVRRFAQKSHDHRGTPENPGRVVTLIHKEDWEAFSGSVNIKQTLCSVEPAKLIYMQDPFPHDDVVWASVAYTIDPLYESEVRDYLDYREKDGYTLEELDVYGLVGGREKVVIHRAFCYVGRNDNPSFIGSEPIDALAERIWHSVGPSGRNKVRLWNVLCLDQHLMAIVLDYLYELVAAVRKLAPESQDSHLYALEM